MTLVQPGLDLVSATLPPEEEEPRVVSYAAAERLRKSGGLERTQEANC